MRPTGARVRIGRGESTVRPLPARPTSLLSLGVDRVREGPPLEELLVATSTDAFVVVHGGELAAEWYGDDLAESPQLLMSITKSFVGCLTGILAARGVVDVDAPVVRYAPELAVGGYAPALVRDVLDMRTGGRYVEDHDDPDGEVAEIARALANHDGTAPTLLALMVGTPRVATSGGPFSYRSLDTEVLGLVLERASGRSLPDLLQDELLAKLGLEHDAEMNVDATGAAHAGGGLSMTARDLARFGRMLLDGGSVGDLSVVPTAFLQDTRRGAPDSRDAFVGDIEQPGRDLGSVSPGMKVSTIYRNQFWVLEQGGRQLLGIGIHGQLLYLDSDNDTVVVKLSSWPRPRDPDAFTAGLECAMVAAEHLGGRPRTPSVLIS